MVVRAANVRLVIFAVARVPAGNSFRMFALDLDIGPPAVVTFLEAR
jgi:hypothetical protein